MRKTARSCIMQLLSFKESEYQEKLAPICEQLSMSQLWFAATYYHLRKKAEPATSDSEISNMSCNDTRSCQFTSPCSALLSDLNFQMLALM